MAYLFTTRSADHLAAIVDARRRDFARLKGAVGLSVAHCLESRLRAQIRRLADVRHEVDKVERQQRALGVECLRRESTALRGPSLPQFE
jgi:hypothetical protein